MDVDVDAVGGTETVDPEETPAPLLLALVVAASASALEL